jgi:hypothetical protein
MAVLKMVWHACGAVLCSVSAECSGCKPLMCWVVTFTSCEVGGGGAMGSMRPFLCGGGGGINADRACVSGRGGKE